MPSCWVPGLPAEGVGALVRHRKTSYQSRLITMSRDSQPSHMGSHMVAQGWVKRARCRAGGVLILPQKLKRPRGAALGGRGCIRNRIQNRIEKRAWQGTPHSPHPPAPPPHPPTSDSQDQAGVSGSGRRCHARSGTGQQLLRRNEQRFRGGLVFKAHTLCVSLNSRLESNREEVEEGYIVRPGLGDWRCITVWV